MEQASLIQLQRRYKIDYYMLALGPLMLLASVLVSLLGHSEVSMYVWSGIFIELLILFSPAYIYMRRQGGLKAFGYTRITIKEWVLSFLMGIGMFFVVTAINVFITFLLTVLGIPRTASAIPAQFDFSFFVMLLFVAAVPAIAEETLFRGALLRAWLPMGTKKAMLHVSLLFALFHLELTNAPALFVAGVVFTYVAVLTGSTYASMAMHFSYNAFALVMVALAQLMQQFSQGEVEHAGEMLAESPDAAMLSGIYFLLIGCVIAYPCFRGIVRAAAKRKGIEHTGPLSLVRAALLPVAEPPLRAGKAGKIVVTATYVVTIALSCLLYALVLGVGAS